jgi:hypothetical protein
MHLLKTIGILTLSLLLNCFPLAPAHAEFPQTLVIADTALDSSMSEFSSNIVLELCILERATCPNGQNFMEGKGSANLPSNYLFSNGFNHGTQMVSASVRTNPNIKIIFIRMVANSAFGARLNSSDYAIAKVLDWVNKNKDQYNIQAVAISQGHHNLSLLTDYCPKSSLVDPLIDKLMNKGIPFLSPAGNSGDKSRIDWPACNSQVISVGALNPDRSVATYGNMDINLIDYFELGSLKVLDANGSERISIGSSVSVQVAAAKWMLLRQKYPDYDFLRTKEVLDAQIDYKTDISGIKIGAIKKEVLSVISEFQIVETIDEIRGMIENLKNLILGLIYFK